MVRRALRGREEARRSRLISPPLDVGATKQPRRAKNRLSERRLTDGYPWSLVHRAGASDQLRDPAGLESALARPAMYAHYQEADLAMQAAILAHAHRSRAASEGRSPPYPLMHRRKSSDGARIMCPYHRR